MAAPPIRATSTSTPALIVGSVWLGADWTAGDSNLVVGPRIRLDAGVGDGTTLIAGSLLLDAAYLFR